MLFTSKWGRISPGIQWYQNKCSNYGTLSYTTALFEKKGIFTLTPICRPTVRCRLSTLILEVQPYLIILIWPHLGVFLVLFRPFGAFFGLDLGLKTFLKPVYVDYQFWLWNYSPCCERKKKVFPPL